MKKLSKKLDKPITIKKRQFSSHINLTTEQSTMTEVTKFNPSKVATIIQKILSMMETLYPTPSVPTRFIKILQNHLHMLKKSLNRATKVLPVRFLQEIQSNHREQKLEQEYIQVKEYLLVMSSTFECSKLMIRMKLMKLREKVNCKRNYMTRNSNIKKNGEKSATETMSYKSWFMRRMRKFNK